MGYKKGLNAELTLTNNTVSLSLQNLRTGDFGLVVIKQDGTGNRYLILPMGSLISNDSGGSLALSTAPNAVDLVSFYYNGQFLFWDVRGYH